MLAGSEWHDEDLVFAQPNGRPIDEKADYDEWARLLQKAGVRHVRLHDGRHTAATLLLSENVHPRVVMELLGHNQMRTTMDIYSHVMPTLAREAADRMGGLRRTAAYAGNGNHKCTHPDDVRHRAMTRSCLFPPVFAGAAAVIASPRQAQAAPNQRPALGTPAMSWLMRCLLHSGSGAVAPGWSSGATDAVCGRDLTGRAGWPGFSMCNGRLSVRRGDVSRRRAPDRDQAPSDGCQPPAAAPAGRPRGDTDSA
jgi:hypothetical protein